MNEDPTQATEQQAPQVLHPNEAQTVTYQDPNAPKAKRKVHVGKIIVLLFTVLVLAGAGAFLYMTFVSNKEDTTTVSDYSGGIAEPEIPKSQVTVESETAKKFLQAVQAKDSATVEQLSSDSLKQTITQQSGEADKTVLSFYEGAFDGIDFNTLISTVTDADPSTGIIGKRIVFTDNAAEAGSTGTYRTEVLVVTENGQPRIATVDTGLKL